MLLVMVPCCIFKQSNILYGHHPMCEAAAGIKEGNVLFNNALNTF